jgi:hypothetical protein
VTVGATLVIVLFASPILPAMPVIKELALDLRRRCSIIRVAAASFTFGDHVPADG